jgi:hypothetical protein
MSKRRPLKLQAGLESFHPLLQPAARATVVVILPGSDLSLSNEGVLSLLEEQCSLWEVVRIGRR